jgi:DNA-binding NarL/FixJ family response regulator
VSKSQLRVVIADDHEPLRVQVREGLEQSGCVVCGEGTSAEEAIRLAEEHRPDVALLDIRMPGDGIQAAREISRRLPETSVVMLTQSTDDDDLFDSLRAGAAGYLPKGTDPARLGDVLRAAMSGHVAMPRQLVAKVMDEFREPSRRRCAHRSPTVPKLSQREWQVMANLSEGLDTDEVAARLGMSPATVRVHVSSVLKKLQVKDRQSAIDALRRD